MKLILPLLIAFVSTTAAQAEAPALNAENPTGFCERFVSPQDLVECQNTMNEVDLDWYAASICAQMEDDGAFVKCIRTISGKIAAPKSLGACAAAELSDDARVACLQKGLTSATKKNSRTPSAAAKPTPGAYQDLNIKPRAPKKK